MHRLPPYEFPGGKNKAVTLSYDDGTIHDRALVSLLNTYGVKCTFHLNSGKLGTPGYIAADEVRSLYKGHEVASHTANHPNLCEFDEAMIVREMSEDIACLTELAGYPVRGFSYPYGAYNDYVAGILRSIGIAYARTVQSTYKCTLPEDFMMWHPTCHHEDDLMGMARAFMNMDVQSGTCAVFYVWGHSYEFNDRNNWNIMKDFCSEISRDSSIWFATNIEIHDHVAGR
ncbi:MAG: polysaccharide deacetylase family protein [Deltaproteobacteria bacterium]|nr:polysaccharide deacetylase family protein [Deltaproteobacteria bacterium]